MEEIKYAILGIMAILGVIGLIANKQQGAQEKTAKALERIATALKKKGQN